MRAHEVVRECKYAVGRPDRVLDHEGELAQQLHYGDGVGAPSSVAPVLREELELTK